MLKTYISYSFFCKCEQFSSQTHTSVLTPFFQRQPACHGNNNAHKVVDDGQRRVNVGSAAPCQLQPGNNLKKLDEQQACTRHLKQFVRPARELRKKRSPDFNPSLVRPSRHQFLKPPLKMAIIMCTQSYTMAVRTFDRRWRRWILSVRWWYDRQKLQTRKAVLQGTRWRQEIRSPSVWHSAHNNWQMH